MSETGQGRLLLPGQQLKQAREAAGLSQSDVANKLRLSTSYVRALEEDDYKRLPEPAFVRGYIRNYARLVGLPGDELASLYQQIQQEVQPSSASAPEPMAERSPVDNRHRWWIAGAVGFVLVIWLLWPSSVEPPPAVVAEPAVESVPAEVEVDEAEAESAEPELAAPSVAEAEPVAPPPDELEIRFVETCWLRVRDVADGELFVGQRDAGQTLRLQGAGPFRITLGNAAAVQAIAVNGQSTPVPAAAPGQVITVRTR